MNLVHSKAAGKPLVAFILNILSTTFYSRTIKIWHKYTSQTHGIHHSPNTHAVSQLQSKFAQTVHQHVSYEMYLDM